MSKHCSRLVVVTWGDAHALSDSWGKFESKDHKPRKVVSVGFVLREDKVGISICQSYDTEKHDDHALFVPAGMIQKVEDIK